MREKMLGISRRLRELGKQPNINMITPDELLFEIADIIDEELQGGEYAPDQIERLGVSIGAQAMGINTIKNEQ